MSSAATPDSSAPSILPPVVRRPYTRAADLPEIMRQRIVVLDGAMGTMIQQYKLGEADYRGSRFAEHHKDLKGNNELLQLTRPDVIREIHEGYLKAGADLIETNTFGATTVAQEDYDLPELAYEMNLAGEEAVALLQMTPFAWRAKPDVWETLAKQTTFSCQTDFSIHCWQRED